MSLARYVFSIKTKVKVGALQYAPYVIMWFNSDEDALDMQEWLETNLANYSKVAVSKTLQEASDNEIPTTHVITDTFDLAVRMKNAAGTPGMIFMNIPGVAPGYDASDLTNLGIVNAAGVSMNKVVSVIPSGRNVIQGSAV